MFRKLLTATNTLFRGRAPLTSRTAFSVRLFGTPRPRGNEVFDGLQTEVLTPHNVSLKTHVEYDSQRADLIDSKLNKQIGYIEYSNEIDHLYIEMMANESRNRHVGMALHEFAFRTSINQGKEGRIRLLSLPPSIFFHYINGYRPSPDYANLSMVTSLIGAQKTDYLIQKFQRYLAAPTVEKENDLKLAFEELAILGILEAGTRTALNRGPSEPVSIAEIIAHCLKYKVDLSEKWEKEFDKQFTSIIIDTRSWRSHLMYLPDETIMEKRKLFGLFKPEPPVDPEQKISRLMKRI